MKQNSVREGVEGRGREKLGYRGENRYQCGQVAALEAG
jgi:hypothetical protein